MAGWDKKIAAECGLEDAYVGPSLEPVFSSVRLTFEMTIFSNYFIETLVSEFKFPMYGKSQTSSCNLSFAKTVFSDFELFSA